MTARQLASRFGQAILTVFLVASLTFLVLHFAPGDPLSTFAESPGMTPQAIAQARRNAGLDRPLGVQYVAYLGDLVHGDLGQSLAQHRPVSAVLGDALPNTLLLGLAGLIVSFGLGLALGAYQGARPDSNADRTLSGVTLTLYAVPSFWLAILLILVFGQWLHWLPLGDATDAATYPYLSPLGQMGDRLRHLVLPATTLGVIGAALVARYQRAAVLDVFRQRFIRTARAKGLTARAVLWRHAMRNALLPAITLLGLELPALLSGVVVIEWVFAYPGLGRVAAAAIFQRDYRVVTGAALLTTALVTAGSLAADLLYRAADPRLRVDA